MARLLEMPVPVSERNVREMVGDTHDAAYPIWRRGGLYPDSKDQGVTLSTVVFRYDLGQAWVYNDNPVTTQPLYKLPTTPSPRV